MVVLVLISDRHYFSMAPNYSAISAIHDENTAKNYNIMTCGIIVYNLCGAIFVINLLKENTCYKFLAIVVWHQRIKAVAQCKLLVRFMDNANGSY